jgi:S-sulfo-L-cysteine synthase (O-acetyl-L-serine-dependent)
LVIGGIGGMVSRQWGRGGGIDAHPAVTAKGAWLVPAARLELARLAAADFESATSTDFVTRAAGLERACECGADYHMHPLRGRACAATIRRAEPTEPTMTATPRYATLEDAIGRTPLVRLQRLPGPAGAARGNVILGKLEGNNPAGSVKDRPAISMIRRAEERGDIKPGDTLIEATSGNTGIALAMAAAIRGYRMALIMPEDLSIERAQTMKAFGAELILTPRSGGMEYARDLAEQMQREGKGRVLDQFANGDNPRVHEETTGPEIWADTAGRVTHFVSAMGTTGTITGVSRYLKAQNPAVRIVGAQPSEGSRIPGIRKWPEAYLPKIYDPRGVDELVLVSQADAEDMARRLAREEGLFAGISAAGACWVALQIAQQVENATIVFIVCDRGDRYLSTGVFPA